MVRSNAPPSTAHLLALACLVGLAMVATAWFLLPNPGLDGGGSDPTDERDEGTVELEPRDDGSTSDAVALEAAMDGTDEAAGSDSAARSSEPDSPGADASADELQSGDEIDVESDRADGDSDRRSTPARNGPSPPGRDDSGPPGRAEAGPPNSPDPPGPDGSGPPGQRE